MKHEMKRNTKMFQNVSGTLICLEEKKRKMKKIRDKTGR
jgi:hypothetical protein